MKKYSLLLALFSATAALAATGTISGTVVDDHDLPAKHLTLSYERLDMASAGAVPQTETDDNGHFSFRIVVTREDNGMIRGARWGVYPRWDSNASDGSGYYPPNSRFYHTEHSNWQEVDVTPEAPDAVVSIKLGPRAGALTGRVTDAVTGAPIRPYATVVVSWASDPSVFMGANSELAGEIDPGTGQWRYNRPIQGKYRILVPAGTELTVKVTSIARGYKLYQHQGVITVGSGQDAVLDIRLQPEDK